MSNALIDSAKYFDGGGAVNCAFDYCLYNKDFKCVLDGINIDSQGQCDDCIMVSIDNEILNAEKERQLGNVENRA